jgi:hypothetical protein
MSPRLPTLTDMIYIRDFVDRVVNDPTRSDINYAEIQTEINIFQENKFSSANVIAEPIPTRIRAYIPPGERELYVHDTFFYAEGRFVATVAPDNKLTITVYAFSLMPYVITH